MWLYVLLLLLFLYVVVTTIFLLFSIAAVMIATAAVLCGCNYYHVAILCCCWCCCYDFGCRCYYNCDCFNYCSFGVLFFAFVYNWMIEYVWPLSITQDILQKKISKKSFIADIIYGWLFSKKLISELSKNMATLCHLLYKQ